ncbi:hypothetical protein [Aureimonas sp. D3]|uniref:hypothetical protein n=1 Tax=Aureimonas sp. D3 TaxID=1638164 RepID=UPI0007865F92|nr:hypothetical protein [Aureimonas sp. D3]
MTIDVIPFGHRKFLVQLFKVANIPDRIQFGRYYEAVCEIVSADGRTTLEECVAHRPSDRLNVVGGRTTDWLVLLVKTDLALSQFSGIDIRVVQYRSEVSEQQAALDYQCVP